MLVTRGFTRNALPMRRRGRVVGGLAILSVALGIAGNALFFSWVNAFVIKPLPYEAPEQLVLLGEAQKGQSSLAMVSMFTALSTWSDYRERSRTLSSWGAVRFLRVSLATGDGSEPLFAGAVTPGTFDMLGVHPARGRLFTETDGTPGSPGVVLLGSDFWRTSLGEDDDALGTVLSIDGQPYEVVGILPDGFELIVGNVDVWLAQRADPLTWPRGSRSFIPMARMAPGTTMEQVRVDVARVFADLEAEHPEDLRDWEMRAYNLRTEYPDPQSRMHLAIIQGMVFFVLLIACANVAILLLARGEERRPEIALRAALGAGRLRILSQLIRESLLTAAVGGVLGLALAALGVRILDAILSPTLLPTTFQPSLDGTVLLFTVVVTVVAGLTFGLVPAVQGLRQNHAEVLKSGGTAGRTRSGGRLTAVLVTGEIALCLVALGGGSMLMRTFQSVRMPDPGFESDDLLSVEFVIPGWKYSSASDWTRILEEIEDRAARTPGVLSAALVDLPPQSLLVADDTFRVGGPGADADLRAPVAIAVVTSEGYPETLGVPLVSGRFFAETDRADAAPVAVVSESLAKKRFDAADPIGQRLRFRGMDREIVGVVGDVQQALVPQAWGSSEEAVYLPMAQRPGRHEFLMLRTDRDPREAIDAVRRAFVAVDPDVTIHATETMGQYARRFTAPLDIINRFLGGFGFFGLLLASLGTYGVVANAVSQRSHELGVRLAVGARPVQVVGRMARRGLSMSLAGLGLGMLMLLPLARVAAGLLHGFGVEPLEAGTLLGVGGVLMVVTLVATVIPASRAARIDPVLVLKSE